MRIAHIVSSLLPQHGGSTRAVLDLACWQSRLGEHCTILTAEEEGAETVDTTVWPDCAVETFAPKGPYTFRYLRGLAENLKERGRAFDLLVIHGSYQYPMIAAARFCRRNRIPYVYMPHGSLDPAVRRKHPRRNKLVDAIYHDAIIRGAASWHFTSENEKRDCERQLWRNCFIEPLGVDVERIPTGGATGAFRERFGIPKERTLFLFLSRITRKKGIDILLEAFSRLVADGLDVHLALAGPVDDDMRPLIDRAKLVADTRSTLTEVGFVTGALKDSAFFDADYFVLPTYSENFGFAAFEALAYGLPLITTTGMNLHAELSKSDRVTIVEPRGDDLYAAMAKAARGEWRPASSVGEVRGWLERDHSWRTRARNAVGHYSEILAHRMSQTAAE